MGEKIDRWNGIGRRPRLGQVDTHDLTYDDNRLTALHRRHGDHPQRGAFRIVVVFQHPNIDVGWLVLDDDGVVVGNGRLVGRGHNWCNGQQDECKAEHECGEHDKPPRVICLDAVPAP